MRTARTLIATAAIATMIPAAAFADGTSPTYPQELADASLATAAATESDHEVCFSIEWLVTEEGVSQNTQPDFACVTNTTTTRSASSSTTGTLLSAVAQLAKVDRVECVVTADGRFTTDRALGSTTTTHRNSVLWTSSCIQYDETGTVIDIDPDDEDSPPCVQQSADGFATIVDYGLWSAGAPQSGRGIGSAAGCDLSFRVQVSPPLDVPILGYNNVHGTGSPLDFLNSIDLSIAGFESQTLCVTATGRQDVELLPDVVC